MSTDTFEYRGHTFKVEITPDEYVCSPWKEFGGTGPVSEWTRREKRAGEWILCEDRGSKQYYDFAEAMKKAKREGWDTPPYGVGTAGERAVRAVTADFERLRRWCNDQWIYAVLHVTLLDEFGDETEYDDCLGWVEYDYSSNGSWMITAREIADEVLHRYRVENRFNHAMECGV